MIFHFLFLKESSGVYNISLLIPEGIKSEISYTPEDGLSYTPEDGPVGRNM
jgi:hypothetical protein